MREWRLRKKRWPERERLRYDRPLYSRIRHENNAAMLIDTHPDAEAMLVELWRRKTPAERFARVCELTEMTRRNAKRAIQQAQPDASPEEVGLRFIELHYGSDLACRVREYLKGRLA